MLQFLWNPIDNHDTNCTFNCAKRTLPPLHIGTRRSSVFFFSYSTRVRQIFTKQRHRGHAAAYWYFEQKIRNFTKFIILDQFQTRLTLGICGFRVPEKCSFSCFRTSFKLDLRLVSVVSSARKCVEFAVSKYTYVISLIAVRALLRRDYLVI